MLKKLTDFGEALNQVKKELNEIAKKQKSNKTVLKIGSHMLVRPLFCLYFSDCLADIAVSLKECVYCYC